MIYGIFNGLSGQSLNKRLSEGKHGKRSTYESSTDLGALWALCSFHGESATAAGHKDIVYIGASRRASINKSAQV